MHANVGIDDSPANATDLAHKRDDPDGEEAKLSGPASRGCLYRMGLDRMVSDAHTISQPSHDFANMTASFEFLGPYRIGKPIGRGGMGSVFEAVHEKTGERVAVKLISQHVADEVRFRRRFDAEVKVLQRLRHQGIVRLIGFGEESGRLFYSMELVEGESLQQRIRREKKLDWLPTIDIAIQVCSALKHAHDIGVLHRDLKPANLLLTSDDTVKIVDFGIAKDYFAEHQTMEGSVLGTADYMAPEQATGTGCTVQTDLYTLGSVMYAMLTGRPPFTGKTATKVIDALQRDPPVPLDLINPELPIDLVELIHELLAKVPADRPPTALAVMNRLKEMRAGLQRSQTIMVDGLPTKVNEEPDPHSNDTNIVGPDLQSKATGVVPASGGDTDVRTDVPADDGLLDSEANTPTLQSGDGATEVRGQEVASDSTPQTRFQTVSEEEQSERRWAQSEADETNGKWTHAVMLVLMLGVLIAGGWYFVQSTRLPGAAESYQRIVDTGQIELMDDFLRRFEGQEAHAELLEEVQRLRMESRLTSTLKRLKTQARLGVTPLNALEQGFVDAMDIRLDDPNLASQKLGLWLDVHRNSTERLGEIERELISIAEFEQEQLAGTEAQVVIDPKAVELIDQIQSRVEKAPTEEVRKMLEGILELYQDDEWAKPALDEAKRQLEAINDVPAE